MKFRYRSVFLSDMHLGFAGIHAAEMSAFLKHLETQRLYLVGDVIDLMALRSKWRWPAMHNQVVRRVLKLAKKGTLVVYIPGNHDDALRQYAGLDLGGVKLATRVVHRTADGKSLLVTHGDEYDLVVQHSRLLCLLGTWAYDHLVLLNRMINGVRRLLGLRRSSFSSVVKSRVKSACTFISNFESCLLMEAARRNLDGVICGHIHQPAVREATLAEHPRPLLYANCGDWIERTTALVEHDDGRLEVIDIEQLLASSGIEVKRLQDDPVPLELTPVELVPMDVDEPSTLQPA
ncbi:MAG: UDP-2,3-diacylglucosamine diphosphatase [Tepidisphaerales bacterium]